MAVAYRSSGTIVANGDAGVDMSSNLPSGLAVDDIMIFVGMDADNEHFDLAMPSGWTVIDSDNANSNCGGTVAWKRYDGTEIDWQFDTPSSSGQLVCGVIHAFSGCIRIGNPINHGTMTLPSNATTTFNFNGLNSLSGNMALAIYAIEDDVSLTRNSHADWTEQDNQTTTVGSDGRFILESITGTTSRLTEYVAGSSEHHFHVYTELVAESNRATITPNTADAHDFGADTTPTLEFTGDSKTSNDLEYEFDLFSAINVIADENTDTFTGTIQLNGTYHAYSQSFTGDGGKLKSASFECYKVASPTGEMVYALYAISGTYGVNSVPTGNILARSRPIDVSTLGTSASFVELEFDGDFTLVNGTNYAIVAWYVNGDSTNRLHFQYSANTGHDGNSGFFTNAWSSQSLDLRFRVYSHTKEITTKESVTPDATFTNTVSGGDTHPFNDNEKISYTLVDEIFDSYSGLTGYLALGNGSITARSQSFTGVGSKLTGVSWRFGTKVGSPTGNVVAKLYAHSGTFGTSSVPTGTALATSDTIDASTINALAWLDFVFSTPYTMVEGTKYVVSVEYSGGDGSNYLQLVYLSSGSNHEGNPASYISSWTASSSTEHSFEVRRATDLTTGTYYWRARAIDPSGANEWSDWTTIRSFDVGSDGSVTLTPSTLAFTEALKAITLKSGNKQSVSTQNFIEDLKAVTLGISKLCPANTINLTESLYSPTVKTGYKALALTQNLAEALHPVTNNYGWVLGTNTQNFSESIHSPTVVVASSALVALSTLGYVESIISANLKLGNTISASTQNLSETLHSVTNKYGWTISTSTQNLTESLHSPTILTGAETLVALSTLAFLESLIAPNINYGSRVSVSTQSALEALYSPEIAYGWTIQPSTQPFSETLHAVTNKYGWTVQAGTQNLVETLYAVTVSAGGAVSVNVATQALIETLYSPTIQAGGSTTIVTGTQGHIENIHSPTVQANQSTTIIVSEQHLQETLNVISVIVGASNVVSTSTLIHQLNLHSPTIIADTGNEILVSTKTFLASTISPTLVVHYDSVETLSTLAFSMTANPIRVYIPPKARTIVGVRDSGFILLPEDEAKKVREMMERANRARKRTSKSNYRKLKEDRDEWLKQFGRVD